MIGTEWIEPRTSGWLTRYASLCGELGVAAFVSEPERDGSSLYNTAWVIARSGAVLGGHRKLSPTPGSEDWSSSGDQMVVAEVDGIRVGLLVCADAYLPRVSQELRDSRAQVIVSLAAWWPGPYGPNGEREQRTKETGIPMLVCNRTGVEPIGDLTGAVSTVVADGRRLLDLTSPTSMLFVVDIFTGEAQDVAMTAQIVEALPVARIGR